MKLGGIFDLENLKAKIDELEKLTLRENFWDDQKESQKDIKDLNILKKKRNEFNKLSTLLEDSGVLLEFMENGETEFQEELREKVENLKTEVENFKIKLLLDEKYDSCNAILTINAGAGGTEACDWA